ncbi:hypothetical protein DMC30DRAFT_370370 [Rhodotorula diobovata]|uniref:TNase-like domain-containing protein n=1 Tax=Rhodotorula diobovata TaxID=5288 RepID=A0A5C5FLY4_9BASI|nr:hypothetical protein DMC30DRAFT_370370 [Rhodotorula diobovata]
MLSGISNLGSEASPHSPLLASTAEAGSRGSTGSEPSRTYPPTASPAASRWLEACSRLDATNPLVVGTATAVALGLGSRIWHRYGRRIRTVDDLTPADLSPARIRGTVTSVGDADGFRLFHRPHLRPWIRPPRGKGGLKGQTLSVRLAGVDAPEMAHFGKEAQPFSGEAFDLLTRLCAGKRVQVELFQKDRYGRVVGMAYVRPFPYLVRRNVSEVLLRSGLAVVYEQSGAVHGGHLARFRSLEAAARARRVGMWSQADGELESPARYKARLRGQE